MYCEELHTKNLLFQCPWCDFDNSVVSSSPQNPFEPLCHMSYGSIRKRLCSTEYEWENITIVKVFDKHPVLITA